MALRYTTVRQSRGLSGVNRYLLANTEPFGSLHVHYRHRYAPCQQPWETYAVATSEAAPNAFYLERHLRSTSAACPGRAEALGTCSLRRVEAFGIRSLHRVETLGIRSLHRLGALGIRSLHRLGALGIRSLHRIEAFGIRSLRRVETLGIRSLHRLGAFGICALRGV